MKTLFISHSSIDKDFANRLSVGLKQQGIEVWLDSEKMQVGDSLLTEISAGLKGANYIVVVLSKNALQSEWVNRELEIAINREIEERRMLVLPALLEDVPIPAFLSGRIFADFRRDDDFQKSLSQIIRAIIQADPLHTERRSNFGVSLDTGIFNTRYSFNNFVVYPGNAMAYSAGLAIAAEPEIAIKNVFIHGGVGIGKTHLIQAIGNYRRESDTSVAYFSAEQMINGIVVACTNNNLASYKASLISLHMLIIDDVQFFLGKKSSKSILLDISRQYCQRGKGIIMASDRPPEDIMPELMSRDQILCRLDKADLQGRRDILYSKRQLHSADAEIPDFAIEFLAQNFSTNIRELEGYLIRLAAKRHMLNQEINAEDLEKLLQEHKNNSWVRWETS